MTADEWEAAFADFERERELDGELTAVTPAFSQPQPEDLDWLQASLACAERRWYVASLAERGQVHQAMFDMMLRAAVETECPSTNKQFVAPCLRDFGALPVNDWLLDIVVGGSDYEKAGALNALYWAAAIGKPPESFFLRKRLLYVEEFLANSDLHVRRRLMASMNLDPDSYPDTHKPLVAQVIELARAHPDEYIRHRLEVALHDVAYRKGQPSDKQMSFQILPTRKHPQGS